MRLARALTSPALTPTLSRWRGRGSSGRWRGRGSSGGWRGSGRSGRWRGRGRSGRWRGRRSQSRSRGRGSLTALTPTLSRWRGRGRSGRWRGSGSSGRWRGRGSRGRWRGRGSWCAVSRLHHRDLGPRLDRLALLGQDLAQDPGHGRRHLGVDLVGVDLEHGLELDDLVPRLDQPARDGALVHRLAELGHHDPRGLAGHQYAARSFKTFVILSGVGMKYSSIGTA